MAATGSANKKLRLSDAEKVEMEKEVKAAKERERKEKKKAAAASAPVADDATDEEQDDGAADYILPRDLAKKWDQQAHLGECSRPAVS